jgi:hypothetical protein
LNQTTEWLLARVHLLVELTVDLEWRRQLDRADRCLAGRSAGNDLGRHWRGRTVERGRYLSPQLDAPKRRDGRRNDAR